MGRQNDGAVEGGDGLDDSLGGLAVHAGKGIVQQQYRCGYQQAPCQSRALPLPAGKGNPPLAYQGFVLRRKGENFPVNLGLNRRPFHPPHVRLRFAVTDVVRQGGTKQKTFLGDVGDSPP